MNKGICFYCQELNNNNNSKQSCEKCKAYSHVHCWNLYIEHKRKTEEYVNLWAYYSLVKVECPYCRELTSTEISTVTRRMTYKKRHMLFIFKVCDMVDIVERNPTYSDVRGLIEYLCKNKNYLDVSSNLKKEIKFFLDTIYTKDKKKYAFVKTKLII